MAVDTSLFGGSRSGDWTRAISCHLGRGQQLLTLDPLSSCGGGLRLLVTLEGVLILDSRGWERTGIVKFSQMKLRMA